MPRKAKASESQPFSLLDMIESAIVDDHSASKSVVASVSSSSLSVQTQDVPFELNDSNAFANGGEQVISNSAHVANTSHTASSIPLVSKSSSNTTSGTRGGKGKPKIELPPFVYPVDPVSCIVCGIDEAGRGPLMGDVVAACVILDHKRMIPGIDDSKHLSEKKRDALAPLIKEYAIAYGIGRASPAEIDELNILHATFLAMRRAYEMMKINCNYALIDGNKIPPGLNTSCQAVVKGDARVKEIGAASILAKTTRDADLYELDKQFPEYQFAKHKGYPTAAHMAVLEKLPILPCYRFSYGPVKKLIEQRKLVITSNHTLLSLSHKAWMIPEVRGKNES